MNAAIRPTVNFTLTEGNAFEVLAGFLKAARIAGWTNEQVNDITADCMAGDHDNLMGTIAVHCMMSGKKQPQELATILFGQAYSISEQDNLETGTALVMLENYANKLCDNPTLHLPFNELVMQTANCFVEAGMDRTDVLSELMPAKRAWERMTFMRNNAKWVNTPDLYEEDE